jgi:hypothetical protein
VVGGTTPTWAVSGSGATPGAITGRTTHNPINTITAGTDVDINATTTSASTVTINSLRLTPGATAYSLTLSNPLTVATGGVLLNPGATNTTITGSTITAPNNGALNGAGNTLSLTATPVPVPEPATVLGLAAVGLGLGQVLRRRRRMATRATAVPAR